jgi:acetylglutamate/LysW-gamma-L-alpha-aminoadipate kinase
VVNVAALVVKLGGKVLSRAEAVVRDALNQARHLGVKGVILVHGGGRIVDDYLRRMGIEPRYVVSPSGIRSRYTDRRVLEVYTMVMAGMLAKTITARLVSQGVKAVSVAGSDCGLLLARRKERLVIINERGRPQVVDGGYTGSIESVNTECLSTLLEAFDVVVVSPLAVSRRGELLNVDGDQVAMAIALAVKAPYLISLTDVEGVVVNGELVKRLTPEEAEELAKKVGPGMNRKLVMLARAVRGGVRRAVIASALREEPVAHAIKGYGTTIES